MMFCWQSGTASLCCAKSPWESMRTSAEEWWKRREMPAFCWESPRFFASRRARHGCGRQVEAGDIGRIVFARSEFSFPGGAGHARAWITDAAIAGGGPIADVGVHCIDSLRYVLQDEVVRVSSRGFQDQGRRSGGGGGVMLEFSRGTFGTVMVSFRAGYRTPSRTGRRELGFCGGEDVLTVERPSHWPCAAPVRWRKLPPLSNQYAYAKQVDAFAAAVEGTANFRCQAKKDGGTSSFWMPPIAGLKAARVEEVGRVS